jgi:hypothetical protein
MDWVTAVWAMLIGGCVTMVILHLLAEICGDASGNAAPHFEKNLFRLDYRRSVPNLAF